MYLAYKPVCIITHVISVWLGIGTHPHMINVYFD